MEDRLDDIINGLHHKSKTKQIIYRNTKETFERMKLISQQLVEELKERVSEQDAEIGRAHV